MKALTTLIAISSFAYLGLCDLGTAAVYGPPYRPNKCYHWSEFDIPPNKMFAAAGMGIWDNGAGCGKWYELRCVAPAGVGTKCTGQRITVKIIEWKTGNRAPVFSLSETAGAQFYTGRGHVKVEYHQVPPP
uniref:Plant natriuretic peptide-like 6 n=1 Tax=Venturia pyrina TaxID=415593 RepID=A0A513ZSA9_9PEZI|nr:plant natriuretic peptide-like 6 [Venturia pyrina]